MMLGKMKTLGTAGRKRHIQRGPIIGYMYDGFMLTTVTQNHGSHPFNFAGWSKYGLMLAEVMCIIISTIVSCWGLSYF